MVEVWNACLERGRGAASFESLTAFFERTTSEVLLDSSLDPGLLERWDEAQLPPDLEAARQAWLDMVSRTAQAMFVE
jgi:hypothetical protein